mmetsp:Transcript_9494/g.25758  ORF Transcript_9494/g.25758 Transcript_9494/m.25758 type:complete len:229 (+) Transcript_9494:237-923(+)
MAATAAAARARDRRLLLPEPPVLGGEGAVAAALRGGEALELLRRVKDVVAPGKARAPHGAAPEHEVQVVALPALQVPPSVVLLVLRVQLVHCHVDGIVLEEPRHGDAGPDLEVPAQQVYDLRDAPEAHGVGVLGVDVPADVLDGFGVLCQAHPLSVYVEAALGDPVELAVQRWGRPPLLRDDDLVPGRHVGHEVGHLGVRLLGGLAPVAPGEVEVVLHQRHAGTLHYH